MPLPECHWHSTVQISMRVFFSRTAYIVSLTIYRENLAGYHTTLAFLSSSVSQLPRNSSRYILWTLTTPCRKTLDWPDHKDNTNERLGGNNYLLFFITLNIYCTYISCAGYFQRLFEYQSILKLHQKLYRIPPTFWPGEDRSFRYTKKFQVLPKYFRGRVDVAFLFTSQEAKERRQRIEEFYLQNMEYPYDNTSSNSTSIAPHCMQHILSYWRRVIHHKEENSERFND